MSSNKLLNSIPMEFMNHDIKTKKTNVLYERPSIDQKFSYFNNKRKTQEIIILKKKKLCKL